MRAVCDRIATGELVRFAAAEEGTNARQIREWSLLDKFAPLYARARANQAHALAEQCIEISDGTDALTLLYEEAAERAEDAAQTEAERAAARLLSSNIIARDRLRLDSRKWYTARVAPKLYGDKLDLTSDGEKLASGVLAVPVPLDAAAWGTIAAAQQAGVRGIAPE